jgi:hypothetical protein
MLGSSHYERATVIVTFEQTLRTLGERSSPTRQSPTQLTAIANALGGMIGILQQASADELAAIYQELRLRLNYDPHGHQGNRWLARRWTCQGQAH